MSGDLAEFLLARIAEVEALARAGAGGWHVGDAWVPFTWGTELDVNFAWLLADCEAKRRIVERAQSSEHWVAAEWSNDYADDGREYAGAIADAWREALRLLALPYAGHPDWREEWRP